MKTVNGIRGGGSLAGEIFEELCHDLFLAEPDQLTFPIRKLEPPSGEAEHERRHSSTGVDP